MEADGRVADSMEVRLALMQRVHDGEITLEAAQKQLARHQATGKGPGEDHPQSGISREVVMANYASSTSLSVAASKAGFERHPGCFGPAHLSEALHCGKASVTVSTRVSGAPEEHLLCHKCQAFARHILSVYGYHYEPRSRGFGRRLEYDMSYPVTVGLAMGVAGNLATNIVQAMGSQIEDTRAGRSLARLGLLRPGFDARLKKAFEAAVLTFLHENPTYNLPEIHSFLESKPLAKDLKEMLLDARGFDGVLIMKRLENYVGIPLSDSPESWPNTIDAKVFVAQMRICFISALGEQADEGTLWLGQALAEQGVTISRISKKLDRFIDEHADVKPVITETNDSFREEYIDHLVGRAQKITTPGARELRGLNQSLSVAYISLNLKSSSGGEAVRAEDFLSKHSHVALRGPAGSGKTTLLNWLITKCRSADDEITDSWKGYVPFFVPLRKVARLHSGPPSLGQLVEYSVDNKLWSLSTPDGWIDKIISKEKRAILMIDGVDELPPSRRVEFWDWVDEFVEAYPKSRVIITSRSLPGAPADGSTNDQWNPPKGFVEAQLQDMSDADVTNFIHHWHDSIDPTKLDEQELVSLAEARATLPAKLEDAANRRIRELCNTPLLCAMICVLHWKEEGYLPRQRVEVYERCCDMLIESRDLKRGVQPPPGPIAAMTKSDKEMVLQQLAIEMMHNRDDTDAAADDAYRIEISKEKALAWIEPRITRFQNTDARSASAAEVLDYLVERTGLLREPAKDLIDFPHRTFQEYLAACAAGADSQETMLARQADDDQWHETIMLAAGTNTGGVGFGRKLIDNLIRRGERHQSPKERSQKIRKTCFALALGCLENLRQQDEGLREGVLSHLDELVPPRNEGDARILSVAGDAAVGYLSYNDWKDENTATVAACARALRLIGTTEAVKALARGYSTDVRQQVISEVCRANVFRLSEVPLVAQHVDRTGRVPAFAPTTDLGLIVGLNGLKELSLDLADAKSLNRISEFTGLKELTVRKVNERTDCLDLLPTGISDLTLYGSALPAGGWIARLPNLIRALVAGVSDVDVVRLIDAAVNLKSLTVLGSDFVSVEAANRLTSLETLYLGGLSKLSAVEGVANHEALKQLVIEDCPGIEVIDMNAGFTNLERLRIEQTRTAMTIHGHLNEFSKLKSLELVAVDGLQNLSHFAGAKLLESVEIAHCYNLSDLSAIQEFEELRNVDIELINSERSFSFASSKLERVTLSSMFNLSSETFVYGLPYLTSLSLERCLHLENLDFLSESKHLSELKLSMMPRISSLSVLHNAPNISSLVIDSCDNIDSLHEVVGLPLEEITLMNVDVKDVEILGNIVSLRSISIGACSRVKDLSFAADLPNLERIWLYPPDEAIYIPEALKPKVSATPPSHFHYRARGPWWNHDHFSSRRGRPISPRYYSRRIPTLA